MHGEERSLDAAFRLGIGCHAPYPDGAGWVDDNVRGAPLPPNTESLETSM